MSDLRKSDQVTRSDRRAYHRIRTGVAIHAGERLRFLTLTFAHEMPVKTAKKKLKFLLRWIRRQAKKFEYFLAHTAEGQGNVLHLAYYGCYLEFSAIQAEWQKLTGAHRINIQEIRKSGRRQFLDFYLEMTRQKILVRYSYSRGWAWKGFAREWKEICKANIHQGRFHKKTALRRWRETVAKNRIN